MRLGVISDTHGLLRPEVFDAFAEVDHILHAGDIGSLDLLTELEAIAPVTAVFGNTDGMDVRAKLPKVARVQLDGFHGHTHLPKLELVDVVVTVMNPGGAGPRRFDIPASVGILELEAGIPPRGRLLPLTGADEG
jgi:predicted phosphodiesterase